MHKALLRQVLPATSLRGHPVRFPLGPVSSLLLVLAALLILAPSRPVPPLHALPSAARAPPLFVHGPRFVAGVPPAPAQPHRDPEREIAMLGERAPRYADAVRERYQRSADLHQLVQEILPEAAAGERASQYHVYLALGQCQAYLRLDAEGARAMDERVLLELNDRPAGERLQWQAEYRRCQGFAGADLGPLRAAMGEDTPGSEVEYASIWFQRAVAAGYAPALAEAALRINLLDTAERQSLLEEAVQGGDPDVYWQLFLNSSGEANDPVSTAGMAWLILACRSGQDCSRGADWFRNACLQDDSSCTPVGSAIEHYWYSLPGVERERAMAMADRMQDDLAGARVDRLPWPSLATRNSYGSRAIAGD